MRSQENNSRGVSYPLFPTNTTWKQKKLSDAFVKVRMADLEKFMSLVGAHQELGTSQEFVKFLSIDGDLSSSTEWNQLIEKICVVDAIHHNLEQPNQTQILRTNNTLDNEHIDQKNNQKEQQQNYYQNIKSLWGNVNKIGKTLKNGFQGTKQFTEYEVDQRNVKAKLVQSEKVFSLSSRTSEGVVNGLDSFSQSCQEFSNVMMKLARFEEKTGEKCGKYTIMGFQSNQRAADYQRLGYGVDKIADAIKKYTLLFASKMIVLQDQLAILPEAIKGLHDREITFHVMEQIRSQLKSKQLKQEQQSKQIKVYTENGSAALREKQQQDEITNLETKLQKIESEYAVQKFRNQEEMERYKYHLDKDLNALVYDYVSLNVQMNCGMQTLWMNIAEQFQTFKLVEDEEVDL
eukprot:TRINITY_DN12146_c0_g1_i2.p1 TRINITY_DN12146_c0_g1~~TRINITY_DN12146_c0_g1_i2.p1  ORF type:complete len:404 (+),score=66.56 TRINITY_DN12146_c0_g1_i2:420-1631(+)